MKSFFELPFSEQFPPIVLPLGLSRRSLGKVITVSNGARNVKSTIENITFHHNLSGAGEDRNITVQ